MNVTITQLAAVVGVIAGVAAASERLVAIITGLFGWVIPSPDLDDSAQAKQVAKIDLLTVACSIATALLARSVLPNTLVALQPWGRLVVIGVLASAGSKFWNSTLAYLVAIGGIAKMRLRALRAQEGLDASYACASSTLGPKHTE